MVTALGFFLLFFTDAIIGDIVRHTNSYAWGHVAQTSRTTYTNPDGSWNDTNIEEIKRLIALLIYLVLSKLVVNALLLLEYKGIVQWVVGQGYNK